MLRSMYSGIGGLRGFQTKLDVIGNNIANVNTTGFKKSRVTFQDIFSQTMSGGSAAQDKAGGTNAKQVGLGSTIATIDTIHKGGNLQMTTKPSDVGIEGNGYFIVQDASGESFLTRDGNFHFDNKGNLVTANGMFVLGSDSKPIKIPTDNKEYSIGVDGKITYTDKDGKVVEDGPIIGLAMVANPDGLEKKGMNTYKYNSPAAGTPTVGKPNSGAFGLLRGSSLEMSNVDLSEEFTEMIVAQRGFQANSRIITTSDSILEELVNLKR
ncbi:flagellar basal body rod protein FlgG [Aneurinibacillus aneurinilyticus]|nr:flagellar basal body rod protein FlgG [Aneurinibacillus aneurinilyticus]MCI1692400.1 flagellar basal-body rod protein FlgF [Aneurinibacillus aneurinilyticus]MED0707428.1 flagellar basal body rod protein FlgG [Aneurinibacillus aneurinilyticus]MED0724764.1 flagellar basal body rod protein FlgG [Aneurinibacillus aneurinilyticus]MED0733214.1 flagellar basal body rod protein FlgG [Aneurinibacillus aneurinilyticus]MED0742809.1 flagellar basal body rod protein FlgG [Aneurinibacillus aneurinilyticu